MSTKTERPARRVKRGQDEAARLRRLLRNRNRHVRDLREKMEVMDAAQQLLRGANQHLELSLAERDFRLAKGREEIERLKFHRSRDHDSFEQLASEIQRLNKDVEGLRGRLKAERSYVKGLEVKLAASKLHEQHALSLTMDVADLKEKLRLAEGDGAHLHTSVMDLTRSHEELHTLAEDRRLKIIDLVLKLQSREEKHSKRHAKSREFIGQLQARLEAEELVTLDWKAKYEASEAYIKKIVEG